ncbi:MAG: c-type cytochrome [Betaproteobacteria bacterium]
MKICMRNLLLPSFLAVTGSMSIQSIAQSSVSHTAAAPIPFAAANITPLGSRAMAANCAACHGTDGHSVGGAVPGLAGANGDYFIAQMKAFKDGKREATVMQQLSKGYSDVEVAALAEYFAKQKK